MKELPRPSKDAPTLVSTFSGCGGSCLGFRMAGYRPLWASEFIPAAQQTYRQNHPTPIVSGSDIRTEDPAEILKAIGLERGELDVLEGSPPCASFSASGNREGDWGKVKKYSDTEQRTDDLFFEFARILEGLKPKVFVAENVAGLVRGAAKAYFVEIHRKLEESGYRVECRLVDAQYLGVPQSRPRTIFVGVREDLDASPAFPDPLPYVYSLGDALEGVEPDDEYDVSIERYAIGREWRKLARGQQSGKYLNLVRADLSLPCPCVTQTGGVLGAAGVCHPEEPRKFTLAELRRVCGFPDDFVLGVGDYRQKWERLGRAVPPVMMAAIAKTVREKILSAC